MILRLLFLLATCVPGFGISAVLPVDEAFKLSAVYDAAGEARVSWIVADGYYLYRDKFKFTSQSDGVVLGPPILPPAKQKQDEFFGLIETYRGQFDVRVPVAPSGPFAGPLRLEIRFQGCADAGICYPPQRRSVELAMADAPTSLPGEGASVTSRLTDAFRALGLKSGPAELLPADEAFRVLADVTGPDIVHLSWRIADGYYLYREKFKVTVVAPPAVHLGEYRVPRGEPKHDDEFGDVEVFHQDVGFDLPLVRADAQGVRVRLQVAFQGCADRGVCYPPMEKTLDLDLPERTALQAGAALPTTGESIPAAREPAVAEHDRIAQALKDRSLGATMLSFLGFGLLLAFTPCIFPMIPILSGIIVGHGATITTGRAFALSLAYVLASAAAYTVFGVLAGLFGSNLQAAFQAPWVIVAFSALFVLLACSMFGFFTLHLPVALQSRIAALSSRQKHGTLLGAAIMGALSALVVGPCVAAPLAGALIYIGQTGDAWMGGAALFSLGIGMGVPLLLLGASAGTLLPRAGVWMNGVKAVFGVGLLAVAVWLLERVIPAPAAMTLWSMLLIIPAIYLRALDPLPAAVSGWHRLWKGVGVVMLVYGVLMLLGVAADNHDPLQPLRGLLAQSARQESAARVSFVRVRDGADLDARLAEARARGQWVMLDYYADWCISCQEMERNTFADARVAEVLAGLLPLQADVTANGPADQALLQRFGLVGPPATLFFGPDGREHATRRIIGYLGPEEFLKHVREAFTDAR
ncbi:protein-disulfide reductase DsbD [Methylolobus aquaticus]|nr:protein-disulfide reductase DsbD [Methylolobus aquaticus]